MRKYANLNRTKVNNIDYYFKVCNFIHRDNIRSFEYTSLTSLLLNQQDIIIQISVNNRFDKNLRHLKLHKKLVTYEQERISKIITEYESWLRLIINRLSTFWELQL